MHVNKKMKGHQNPGTSVHHAPAINKSKLLYPKPNSNMHFTENQKITNIYTGNLIITSIFHTGHLIITNPFIQETK